MPFPDALQEFKVETSAVPAQYGQHSAGAVNAVTSREQTSFMETCSNSCVMVYSMLAMRLQ